MRNIVADGFPYDYYSGVCLMSVRLLKLSINDFVNHNSMCVLNLLGFLRWPGAQPYKEDRGYIELTDVMEECRGAYRKATSQFEAKEIIMKSARSQFDPVVVRTFNTAFTDGERCPNLLYRSNEVTFQVGA
jgi:hypothetical protein